MEKQIDLKKYLKQILDLETEKNRLEQIETNIQFFIENNLKPINKSEYIDFYAMNRRKNDEIRQYENKIKVEKPIIPKKPEEPIKSKINPLVYLIFGIIMFIFGICIEFALVYVLGGFVAVVAFFGLYEQISNNNDYKKQIEIYENAMFDYNNAIKEYNKNMANNEQKTKDYHKKIQEKYDKELEEKEKLFENKSLQLETIIGDNLKLLTETKNNIKLINTKLKEIYDLDIVFEKYRNLIAIATFYEYFASSRVSELEGKDGAYNLFESEIRQNLIIIQLDTINKNLNAIKQNQYILYKELNNINDSLKDINDNIRDIKAIVSDIKDVEIDTNIINKYILNCSNQINKNLSTIKSLNIADFYLK